jgi:thiosulfate/3-mercaptopyruvate sulfurtransferase
MIFGPLVTADWLRDHLTEVAVVDVRWYLQVPGVEDGLSGLAEYESGHIPGAVWLDIDSDLSSPASDLAGRHPLPAESTFAVSLGRMGIPDGKPVVAYDDSGGGQAARLWYMLDVLGEPVAVLDGGLTAWVRAGGELTTEVPVPYPVQRAVREWPARRFADADAVATAAANRVPLLDARSLDRFDHGGPIDPRPGHIPGAASAPWQENLGEDGCFRSPQELRQRYAALGVTPGEDGAIAYCGSGVTACHTLLALTLAGVANSRLYVGSWSQWGADVERPAQLGAGVL